MPKRQRLQAELAADLRPAARHARREQAPDVEVGHGQGSRAAPAQDIGSLVASLPPDPRNSAGGGAGGSLRGARRFAGLQRRAVARSPGANPFGGVMQFVVAGASGRADDTVALPPVSVSVGLYDTVRGSLPLPRGFKPRQTTIQVLDKVGGKLVGMRVINLI
jgi:hypothetical protein